MPDTPSGRRYPETADIETSSDDYATRFAGATGAWMLAVQERLCLELLRPERGGSVLDVGGGHGQLAIPLCREGWKVTVLGSDDSCRHRLRDVVAGGACAFVTGDVTALPFPDASFDAVICFRLLTHCGQWPKLVAELCRVSAGPVVVDYPTSQSVNAIAPALFGAKKRMEGNTRTWTLFRHRQVADAFAAAGYRIVRRRKQFFLPMVLHRGLKAARLSARLEQGCRLTGLTALAGSPVIARAEPADTKGETR